MKKWQMCSVAILAVLAVCGVVWLIVSANAETPAGYVGYVTQGSVFGHTQYLGTQVGPTSTGKTWLVRCANVSVTPFTYDELFKIEDNSSVLSKDRMKISFGIHVVFRIQPDKVRDFIEKYSTMAGEGEDKIVPGAYQHFVRERLRTYARVAIEKYNWQELQAEALNIQKDVDGKVRELCAGTPFEIISVAAGNIQYPDDVAKSVAEAQAATQILQRKENEIKQVEADAKKRVAEARGIAEAMDIVNQKLTPQYLQHEAIESQKGMVNSPNHTTVYLPVGPMGVPLTGTFPADGRN